VTILPSTDGPMWQMTYGRLVGKVGSGSGTVAQSDLT